MSAHFSPHSEVPSAGQMPPDAREFVPPAPSSAISIDDATGYKTQADQILSLAQSAALFHTPDQTGYADILVCGHRETWPVRSKNFRSWLVNRFFESTGKAASSDALQTSINTIDARALLGEVERAVFVRVGGCEGRIYLDLCDKAWRAIEIDQTGWRIADRPPIRFRRAANMSPLPIPVTGSSIDRLREFLHLKNDDDFVLAVAWLLGALREVGPYPLLVLSGEQGGGKSFCSTVLRALIDPNTVPLRSLPRETRDLFVSASKNHVLAFDNLSGVAPWLSDSLCRLSTGGGFATRALRTDTDEITLTAMRPIILNGIDNIVTRPDLADRALFLTLSAIPEVERRAEAGLWARFDQARAPIFGALLDGIVAALQNLPATKLDCLPRLADFALWVSAAETAFWKKGTFAAAFRRNRAAAIDETIDADPVASGVRKLMSGTPEWHGTASELASTLAMLGCERSATMSRNLSPIVTAGKLRRVATFLRAIGIETAFTREGRSRTRMIHITLAETA